MDVSDQCSVKQGLCFYPEIISGFAVALGVGDQNGYQLQNILFAVNVSEGIVMHTLLEVDGIQDLQSVSEVEQHLTAFGYDTALRKCFVKTECAFCLQTFYEQLTSCLDGDFIRTWRRCECRF